MKRPSRRPLVGGFLFMMLFGLFGAPTAPVAGIVPTVGGYAVAEPCDAWSWDEDCEPQPEPEPEPEPEPPGPREPCRGDGYPCAPDRVPFDCTSLPTGLGYGAFLMGMAALAVPVLAIPAVVLGVAAYYTSATCEVIDNE